MSILFFDSSALVKRYLTEIGSTWVIDQTDPDSSNLIVVAEITRVEVAAALAARHRTSGGITRMNIARKQESKCPDYFRAFDR